jgi:hypothetical protein
MSPTSSFPLRAGKAWIYEGGIRVPLIIKLPAKVQAGLTVNEQVVSTDLYPTILELVGLPLRPEQHVDGVSLKALYEAVRTRKGFIPEGLILHSDRGSTYASGKHREDLAKFGIEQSMSAKGNCYDNAAQESFYRRYKTSSVGNYVFADLDELRANAFEYIECYYNTYRKHSSLGYKTPMQIESKKFPPRGEEFGHAVLHSHHATNNN